MNTQEWALIIFTILTQMSIGAFVVLGVMHYLIMRKAGLQEARQTGGQGLSAVVVPVPMDAFALGKVGIKEADRLSDPALPAILITLGLGMLASLFHLGNPMLAYKAVTNFDTSWLSREILLGVVFTVLAVVFVAMQWRKIATAAVRNAIAAIAAIVGLGMVYSQAQIYMLETQPAWNTPITVVMFFASTFLLGVLAIGAALVASTSFGQRKDPEAAAVQNDLLRNCVRWIAVASIILVGIELVVTPLYMAFLGAGPAAAKATLGLMANEFSAVLVFRMLLGFLGAGVLSAFLYKYVSGTENKYLGTLVYGAFALVFIAELLARYLFYATHFKIGV